MVQLFLVVNVSVPRLVVVEVLQEKVIVLGLDVRVAEEGLTDRRVLQHDEGGDDVGKDAGNEAVHRGIGQLLLDGHLTFVEEQYHVFLCYVGK